VATTHCILWEHCRPVFADIEPGYLCIDPKEIEKKITPRTQAILATHVYGNACQTEAIAEIAKKHNLYVIYDAAHAFASYYKGKPLYSYGDISTASFHATKIFQTVEGGAVFTPSGELLRKMALLRNFGHSSPISYEGIGINGKNSELHAAMGLSIFPYMTEILTKRKQQWLYYKEKLQHSQALQFLKIRDDAGFNYSYFPVIIENTPTLQKAVELMQLHHIFPRRYFYPSLNELMHESEIELCPVSSDVSARIVCLPLYHLLSKEEQDLVIRVLLRALHN
jgi:dTDP-4-amino-4,6-dideoxygalactose transaminase